MPRVLRLARHIAPRQTDRQRNARPKPRTTKWVVWRTDTQLPVPKRRPHTHPSRRCPPSCMAPLNRIMFTRSGAHVYSRAYDSRTSTTCVPGR
eukprot:scaffold70195_cov63-Phaeocystis_antarctica.AAC.1